MKKEDNKCGLCTPRLNLHELLREMGSIDDNYGLLPAPYPGNIESARIGMVILWIVICNRY